MLVTTVLKSSLHHPHSTTANIWYDTVNFTWTPYGLRCVAAPCGRTAPSSLPRLLPTAPRTRSEHGPDFLCACSTLYDTLD